MRLSFTTKKQPGAMYQHRGPGFVVTPIARNFNMRTIAPRTANGYLEMPLFQWANRNHHQSRTKLKSWRVNPDLLVESVEVHHG